jgi:DNA-binding NarL/FixJ family response regulator
MSETAIRVAVAEDQALFRECLVAKLKEFDDIEITSEAINGKELINQIEQQHQVPDIVLMDLNMPEMNGMDTTRYLRSHFPAIKIVILSVYAEPQYIAAMVEQGVNGYIVKNALFSEVKDAIRNVHLNGFYFNQDVLKAMQTGMMLKKPKTLALDNADMLTLREKEVLQMICQEFTAAEIADKLFISKRTVDGHRNNLLLKTGCRNTAGLVLYAIKNSLYNSESPSFLI